MTSVDDSLHRWCQSALKSARLLKSEQISETSSVKVLRKGERLVDLAAFLKLAEIRRKRHPDDGFDSIEVSVDAEEAELIASLVKSCPVDDSTSPEILGTIHEQLVGYRNEPSSPDKRRTQASRKRSGIFYTPPAVIDYILRETLGRHLEGATPETIQTLSILDPAAGCGAFLVAAFRYLVDWHRNWYVANNPKQWPEAIQLTQDGWRLTRQKCQSLLERHLFGVDLDEGAIEVAKRILWLTFFDLAQGDSAYEQIGGGFGWLTSNLKQGHSLIGREFGSTVVFSLADVQTKTFDWDLAFPQIAGRGGFEIVVGNPPYRRERNFKYELDQISATSLGCYRTARMDLWYYFVHRGIQLLRDGGTLSFITNAYWMNGSGAEKLLAAFRDEVHLDELFLLRNQPVFPGVSGQHLILRLTKCRSDAATTIKIVPAQPSTSWPQFLNDDRTVKIFFQSHSDLFREHGLNTWPSDSGFVAKLKAFPQLGQLGVVRQGIAENPASINRRTIERFPGAAKSQNWQLDEGVFSLTPSEIEKLGLNPHEVQLLRPYHDLCDLKRYWLAQTPSRRLIYSTRLTCPEITEFPAIQKHLERARTILEARRETRAGSNQWWHLHWPRDERIWQANKIIVLQMAPRPSFVPTFKPTYVSFSANVFLPAAESREDLHYFSGLLNSRVIWAWLQQHAKRRGVGLELNGHVIEQIPIRRIDFGDSDDVHQHDELVKFVETRMQLEQSAIENKLEVSMSMADEITKLETQIDTLVSRLYGLNADEFQQVVEMTQP